MTALCIADIDRMENSVAEFQLEPDYCRDRAV